MRKLRIGVDLAPLRSPLTGIGNYELFLLDALLSSPNAPQFEGFAQWTWRKVDEHYLKSFQSAPMQVPALSGARSHILQTLRGYGVIRRIHAGMRQLIFEQSIESKALSLFHAFAYLAPGYVRAPVIPVVYDVSFMRFPETHPPERLRMLQPLEKHVQSAAAVHTISHFSAREIADVLAIPISRIAVIYPGVNPIFATPSETSSALPAHFKLTPDRYFLAVSTLEPRKNLRSLIIAYSRLSQAQRKRFPLCVVGATGWGSLNLPKVWKVLEREGSLRFLGFVPNGDLRALYTHTRTMFYPSIYEGFGMPIIEALACGARVVCSNGAAMPEAAGKLARYVVPLDVDGWEKEIQFAAEQADHDLEEKHRRQHHARQFTWSKAAAQTLALYQRVVA